MLTKKLFALAKTVYEHFVPPFEVTLLGEAERSITALALDADKEKAIEALTFQTSCLLFLAQGQPHLNKAGGLCLDALAHAVGDRDKALTQTLYTCFTIFGQDWNRTPGFVGGALKMSDYVALRYTHLFPDTPPVPKPRDVARFTQNPLASHFTRLSSATSCTQ